MIFRQIILAILLALSLTSCLPAAPPAISTPTGLATAPAPPPIPSMSPPGNTIQPQLAWFYKPPFEADELFFLAREYNFFILTRGDEQERGQLLDFGAHQPILQ